MTASSSEHAGHRSGENTTLSTSAHATAHCLAGCMIGEVAGLAIGVTFGLDLLAVVNAQAAEVGDIPAGLTPATSSDERFTVALALAKPEA